MTDCGLATSVRATHSDLFEGHDAENLPPPAVLAQEIVEQLEAALEEFRSVEEVLAGNRTD